MLEVGVKGSHRGNKSVLWRLPAAILGSRKTGEGQSDDHYLYCLHICQMEESCLKRVEEWVPCSGILLRNSHCRGKAHCANNALALGLTRLNVTMYWRCTMGIRCWPPLSVPGTLGEWEHGTREDFVYVSFLGP